MAITKKEVEDVARLARLALSPEEVDLYTTQMQRILGYVEKLSELDTSGVEPSASTELAEGLMREDTPRGSLDKEEALGNAPARARGCFKVPQIIE